MECRKRVEELTDQLEFFKIGILISYLQMISPRKN